MLNYSELIKTLWLDPIEVGDETWQFKIEIFQHSQKGYFVKLWRQEFYNIHPTFCDDKTWQASESFFVDETYRLSFDDHHYFDSLDNCIKMVLNDLDKIFYS